MTEHRSTGRIAAALSLLCLGASAVTATPQQQQPVKPDAMRVVVTDDNRVLYNGKNIGLSGVEALTRRLLKRGPLQFVVETAPTTTSAMLVGVLDELKRGGATDVVVGMQEKIQKPSLAQREEQARREFESYLALWKREMRLRAESEKLRDLSDQERRTGEPSKTKSAVELRKRAVSKLKEAELATEATSASYRLWQEHARVVGEQRKRAAAKGAGAIRGSVLDRVFGAGVENARVIVVETGQELLTSKKGEYVLEELAPGRYTIACMKDGFGPGKRAHILLDRGQLVVATLILRGKIVDMEEVTVDDGGEEKGSVEGNK